MRHVAIFVPVLNGGGAERIVRHLGSEFSRGGTRCDLLVATDQGPILLEPPAGVRVIWLHKKNSRQAIPRLAQYVRQYQPDVVMSTVFSANIAAIIAIKILRSGSRLVIREASRTDVQISSHRGVKRYIDLCLRRLLYPRADFVISVSEDVQSALIKSGLVNSERSCVIYNPLTRPFSGTGKRPASNAKVPELLACGRLEAEKDYPTLLRAVELVLRARDVTLTILGDGALLAELRSLATELGIGEHVAFEGFVEDTQPYLERASVFVHTSRYEGFPSAILEAIAAGCPVVATESPGGAGEILRGGELGALVPVGDAHAVAASVLKMLDGTTTFSVPSDYATRFSLPNIAARYLTVLFPDK